MGRSLYLPYSTSPGTAFFGRDMLFDVPFLADWNKVGDCRQHQTDRNTARENKTRVEWDCAVGDKVLVRKEGILQKSESKYEKEPLDCQSSSYEWNDRDSMRY
jgi:hypothetical protein